MSDIVERLRLLVPSDSSGAAIKAADELTRLRSERSNLLGTVRLHKEQTDALGARVESLEKEKEDILLKDRLRTNEHNILVEENRALRAENEKLRAALEAICMMDISWVGDAFKLKDIARAALEGRT